MTEAWITLATNDRYAQGALTLLNSLHASGTTRRIHCLITNEISNSVREKLVNKFDEVTVVDIFNSNDSENLSLIGRPDLGVTFTKFHCWRLTQYSKAVFLDADTMIIRNSDELFERPDFSAAADIGWPDMFNSGVFVFTPSLTVYRALLSLATSSGSFDGGDQGLLNEYFSNWRDLPSAHRLPFIYNMTAGEFYSYPAAYRKYGAQTKIVHFIGAQKPWNSPPSDSGLHKNEHYQQWHSFSLQSSSSSEAPAAPKVEDDSEKQRIAWEAGHPDYLGKDAFKNIQKALDESMAAVKPPAKP
ncbi:glycogenin glucosyltransferase [Caenorhabditis elegans]|uniref:glycogenin glucosyltransferase n=1 Tax=Caenorhabditis elegans TaxID=6239 RepID=O45819_CAEEL|nr:GlYcoGenin like [Caenorhabditis elegans]CAB04823.1 GlYcoGenin like [Caenorhabditis elegans]|eukprot:NP_507238.1 GlYcoGenin like [Caenorhabditis elegans]